MHNLICMPPKQHADIILLKNLPFSPGRLHCCFQERGRTNFISHLQECLKGLFFYGFFFLEKHQFYFLGFSNICSIMGKVIPVYKAHTIE